MSKRYVVSVDHLVGLRGVGKFTIGTKFIDHRIRMVVTAIGKPFRQGKEHFVYVEAEEKSTYTSCQQSDLVVCEVRLLRSQRIAFFHRFPGAA